MAIEYCNEYLLSSSAPDAEFCVAMRQKAKSREFFAHFEDQEQQNLHVS